MKNSQQIKEVPAPPEDDHSQKIFQNFTDATVALLDSSDLPEGVHDIISDAVDRIGNELGAHNEYAGPHARRVLCNIFNLPHEDFAVRDIAAKELAYAFAAIEEYHNYMPAGVYNQIADAIMDWVLNDNHFIVNPKMMRAGLPGILREIFAAEGEFEGWEEIPEP